MWTMTTTTDNLLARKMVASADDAAAPARVLTGARAGLKPGSVNIDMDTLADYAGGYGFEVRTSPDPVYTRGLVRFLDHFKALGVRSTIFVIARDAAVPEHAEVLRRAIAEGHEIANHTLTHPRQLSRLSDAERRREIVGAHEILSGIAGREIVGFRAPCYDICGRTLALLRELNYRYDSSVHPSIAAPLIDIAVLLKSRLRKWEMRPGSYVHLMSSLQPFLPANANAWRKAGSRSPGNRRTGLLELPLSALPVARVPFYGTWTQMTGMKLFHRSMKWLGRFNVPLNFHFHAVELIGLEDDGVDPRFQVHPGMSRPVIEKSIDVAEMLRSFASKYELMTLESMAEKAPAGGRSTDDAPLGKGT